MRALLICVCLLVASAASAAERPNVLVVLLDDLGFSDLGLMGSEIHTPHIDALASGGVTYTQFYVSPRCSPTRASLLTGHDPHAVGLGFLPLPEGVEIDAGPYQGYLKPDAPTIAEALREAGYATYMSGKWHVGEAPEHWPTRRGFDRYFGLISGASSYYEVIEDQPMKRVMAKDGERWRPPENGFYMTHAFSDAAVDYLKAHQSTRPDDPFFLYLAYTAPHWPLHAPEAAIDPYRSVYSPGTSAVRAERRARLGEQMADLPPVDPVGSAQADLMAAYAAMVTLADEGVGRVMRELEDMGALDNTLVLVFSDNGACAEDISSRGLHQSGKPVGARGSYLDYGAEWAKVSNTPLRGVKGTTFEGGIRTPLVAHWPKGIPRKGALDNESVLIVQDVHPTILQLAGLETNQPTIPLKAGSSADRLLFWAHVGWRAVRDGDWKAVFDPQARRWQLFNLAVDPGERSPVDDGERLGRMRAAWDAWAADLEVDPAFDPRAFYRKLFSG